ncbi:MAG: FkbM family methyltransferase [Spirochaetes bacterium]|nr:FkbM family methyltransferase [Spirochaetota bacterium]
MTQYYSQHGEDFILDVLFDKKEKGFFMEIGCIEGIRFSNTYHFEQKGWTGICIEAHNDYIDMLKRNRPGSKVIHCAIGNKNEENVTFYANSRGSLSTLDKNKEKTWKTHYTKYFTGFEEQKITEKTIDSIIKSENVKSIDFISLDIEGYEVEALEGMKFEIKPEVFVIESDSKQHRQKIEKILFKHGYYFLYKMNVNLFYALNTQLKNKILNKKFTNIILYHEKHPLDNRNSKIVKTDVNTKFLYNLRLKIKQELRNVLSKIKKLIKNF